VHKDNKDKPSAAFHGDVSPPAIINPHSGSMYRDAVPFRQHPHRGIKASAPVSNSISSAPQYTPPLRPQCAPVHQPSSQLQHNAPPAPPFALEAIPSQIPDATTSESNPPSPPQPVEIAVKVVVEHCSSHPADITASQNPSLYALTTYSLQ
jgi:hypothetical protein